MNIQVVKEYCPTRRSRGVRYVCINSFANYYVGLQRCRRPSSGNVTTRDFCGFLYSPTFTRRTNNDSEYSPCPILHSTTQLLRRRGSTVSPTPDGRRNRSLEPRLSPHKTRSRTHRLHPSRESRPSANERRRRKRQPQIDNRS